MSIHNAEFNFPRMIAYLSLSTLSEFITYVTSLRVGVFTKGLLLAWLRRFHLGQSQQGAYLTGLSTCQSE